MPVKWPRPRRVKLGVRWDAGVQKAVKRVWKWLKGKK